MDNLVKIPMNIMQTWKTNEVPDHWKPSVRGIQKHMSHWNYKLMTDEDNRNFVQTYFPGFLSYYDNFEYGIQRADAIRYMWLYVVGGLYLDLDIQVVKPLDELFYEDKEIYVVRSGNFGSFYTNAFMAAKKGSNVMLKCLEEMKKPYAFWNVGKHLKVMNSTGPLMFTRALKLTKNVSHNKYELPTELLMSCSVCDKKPCDIRDGYCRILDGSSWVERDTQFYIYCTCNAKPIIITILILIIFAWIVIKSYKKNNIYKCQRIRLIEQTL